MSIVNAKAGSELLKHSAGSAEVAGDDGLKRRQATLFEGAEMEIPRPRGPYAGVVFNRPIEQVLTYRIPSRFKRLVQPGQRVKAPLGKGDRPAVGYCVRIDSQPPPELDLSKIKDLLEVVDPLPLIDGKMLALTRWMADYYACAWGQALNAVVPAGVKKHAGTRVASFLIVPGEIKADWRAVALTRRLTPKQAAVLEILCKSDEPLSVADVCRLGKCTSVPIQALRKEGVVLMVKRRLPVGLASALAKGVAQETDGGGDGRRPEWTPQQQAALAQLRRRMHSEGFAPFLIHGATGSGKTEVYLAAIEEIVARGREAIVLVPEISLTPQTIRRFRRRFERVAVLHSHLSDAERHRHWQSIAAGEVQVVVGARSAVFAPTRRLGLLVVDEEHESTFKQETTPRYHAHDLAVKRAQMEGVPVLLGSATPSLESWLNSERGRYTRLSMPARVGERPMPAVEIVDLRGEKIGPGGLSEPLRQAIDQALHDGGQVILLLNRRGFHTFVICPRCGAVVKCHACDVAVTYHRRRHILLCHTCDAERACPPACPGCGRGSFITAASAPSVSSARFSRYFPVRLRGGWTPTQCAATAATSRSWPTFKRRRSRFCWAPR